MLVGVRYGANPLDASRPMSANHAKRRHGVTELKGGKPEFMSRSVCKPIDRDRNLCGSPFGMTTSLGPVRLIGIF